jgi:hypothetical protein
LREHSFGASTTGDPVTIQDLLQIMDYILLMLVSHDDDGWLATHHYDEISKLVIAKSLQAHSHRVEGARRIWRDELTSDRCQKLTRQSPASPR